MVLDGCFIRRRQHKTKEPIGGTCVKFKYSDLRHMTKNFSTSLAKEDSALFSEAPYPDQHINLIRLLGFCCEGTKRLLVYEYMPNGSFGSSSFSTGKILTFCPKVSDFGMAKLIHRDFSQVLTSMRGTVGYLAPEWILGQPITPKADVYSFGMMLFEVVSGRRNTDQSQSTNNNYFPVWAARKLNEGDVLSLLDENFTQDRNMEELSRVCKVACWCIQENEAERPSMGVVVLMLEGLWR
ncbi:G-type lectin S-receptor-like serine/threonine-protein kinase At2g19130 [Dioscorea cayenensis subsp. rotundata]|uniref:G-type lectin S-receptor-like serine/threonine-protein kinase At2g19130 n=1 Tax=Dioscorea cayennensis subsp. rotundata TaxID=55577 RepID=A0AB40AZW1_DIOCR|nr:G-type lectin S-receptor-like serine/threonine-protein kinase At2g19130 [Dioscorea cayenensis subsp. rotundata]